MERGTVKEKEDVISKQSKNGRDENKNSKNL